MKQFNAYKQTLNFLDWYETSDFEEVYCITDNNGNELFDVLETDFIEMVDKGIVNSNGDYYLLNNPTDDEIAQYAKEYGVKWIV